MAEFSGRAAGPGQGRQAQPGHTTLMGGAFQSPPGAPRWAVTMDWKLLYWMNFTVLGLHLSLTVTPTKSLVPLFDPAPPSHLLIPPE